MGGDAGEGHGQPGHPHYNAKAARAKTDARGDASMHVGRRASTAAKLRARRRQDGLLHLPPVVDHELRRLPPADPGQLEDRAAPLRGRRDAQLRDLQPAGRARRHVPARRARRREGRQDRAGALVARRWCCRRPTSTASASTSSSRRSPPRGFSSQAFAPHYPHTERKTETKTCTDCHVSQANDNNAIMAQLLLHGTNFVNFVGFNAWVGEERRRRGGAGHRVGRAAGGDRQLPAPLRLSRLVRRSTRSATCELPEAHDHTARADRRMPPAARRIPLRRRRARAACASTTSPASPTRASRERIITAPFSPLGQDTARARRRTRPAWRCRPTSRSIRCATQGDLMRVDEPGAADPPDLQLRLRHRRGGGPDRGRRRHARRRRAAQQLPQARGSPGTRTACSTARATSTSAGDYAYVAADAGARDRRPRRSAEAAASPRVVPLDGARARRRCSSATSSSPTPTASRWSTSPTRASRARVKRRARAARRCARALRRAHLRLCRRRARGPRDRRRRAARAAALYMMFNADGQAQRRARRASSARPTPRSSPTSPTARTG